MSPDRERTIKFIDWTLTVFRKEWMDAPLDGKKAAFEKINKALEMRVEVMKLINYDQAIQDADKPQAKKPKPKIEPPPSL